MSGAILSSIIRWSVDTLSTYLAPGVDPGDGVYKLKSMMAGIQATLDEAEERNVRENSERLRLEELKQIAYDAEDLVGEWEYEVLRSKVDDRRRRRRRPSPDQPTKGAGGKMALYDDAAACYPVAIPQGLANRVREVTERFEEITREWGRLCLPERAGKKRRVQAWKPPETASFGLHQSGLIGRDEEKQSLINFLLSEEEAQEDGGGGSGMVSVIPVLGMGGVGKTALAQVVYNEPSVRKHFQHRGWLCISDHFDVLDITRKIIKSFTGETVESTELDELQDTLNQELKGRRFLLVLDDVWNDEPAPWESLKAPLLSAGHGKVIVTTRNASVAKIMQTVPPLQLGNLSFQDSWTLFENLAFGRRRPDAHANLAEMGEKIVERCKGLPLAIKVLGCILGNEHEEETWAEIVESQLWEIDEEKDEILPALKLSYDRMPAHLKRCFMYLSLFPKNYPIEKERIVRLWMAQGLLHKGDGELEEDSGYAYIDEMLQRSILQYPDGEGTDEFIMHDLIHDLAQRVAGGEYLRIAAHEASEIPKQQVRHLSLVFKNVIELKYLQPVLESKLLRTLLIVFVGAGVSYDTFELDAQNALFEKLKFLRALDLYHFNMRELADSIGGLRHLRYLRLQDIKSFPESICELHNLQVIEIDSVELPELPRGVGNLINLRHLVVDGETTCTPYEVGELTNLQTLQNVRVDPWHCSLGQLKDLVNLRGTLKIDFLDNLLPFPGAPINEKYLRSKKRLATLSLRWNDAADGEQKCSHFSNLRVPHDDDDDDGVDDKGAWQLADHVLLESLEPNANLGYLQIVGYKGSSFPRWLGYDSFSNLETLLLTACPNCEFLPPLGQLPSLKHLMIGELGRVASVGREFCALDPPPPALSSSKRFRSLEYLRFEKMDKWTAWHGVDSSDFPCLRKLEIDNCEELRELPECLCSSPTTRLEALGLSGCPNLNGIPEHLFSSLVELSIQSTPNVLTAAPSLPMLQSLLVMESRELSVLDLHGLPLLRVLSISDCSGLRSLSGLGILASLWDLRFDDCPRLQISEHDTLPPSLERVCILKSPGAKNWYRTQKMCSANQSHPEEEFSEEDADSEIKQLGEEEEKYFDMEELGAGGNDGASEGTEELDEDNEMKELWRGEEEEEEEEDNDNEDVEEESGEFVSSDSTVAAASSGCKRRPVQFLKHKKKRT